jgi:multicomponent Na+:H+ antiporter subunit D
MSWLLVLPIVIPIVTAVLALLIRTGRWVERGVSIVGGAALLGASVVLLAAVLSEGTLAGQMGDWPAPFGITLVADLFGAVMVLITGLTGFLIAIYALVDIDPARERFGFHSLYHILLSGVCGAFLAGDLFNLYVWFEVMLIASFSLLALGGEKAQIDGAVKYVAINLVSTILFLTAVGLLYGATGTLNMAELHLAVREVANQGLIGAIAVLFVVAFGIKAAVFPLFFWLPASYHTPPTAVAAIFSALMTKVGVYALIRVFTLIFTQDVAFTHGLLLVVAALTMITGVLGAAAHNDIRRILSFHIVSQIGYMVLGLALYTPLALVGAVFYLIHHIIVKANLFLIGGVIRRVGGSFDLDRLGGLYRSRPLLALLFVIPAFSLAGFPPLSGFWAKLILIKASLDLEQYLIAATALVVGLLTIYSMTKIWTQAFWKSAPAPAPVVLATVRPVELALLLTPIVVLASLTVTIGLWPQPFLEVATGAADALFDPGPYLFAVLGARP